jgi:hypothetical protein
MVEIVNTLKGYLKPEILVENVYVFAVLCIFLTMYGPRLHMRLPPTLMGLFNNAIFRAAILFLIAYMSHKDFVGALAITIIFMVSLNILHTHSVLSGAVTDLSKSGTNVLSSTSNNIVNLLGKTVQGATNVAQSTAQGTTGLLRNTVDNLGNVLGTAVRGASNIVTAESENVAEAVGDVAGLFGNTVGGLASATSSAVGDVARVMSSTIGDVAGLVGDTIGDVSSLVGNTFSDVTGAVDTGVSGAANITRSSVSAIQQLAQPAVTAEVLQPVTSEEGFHSSRIEHFNMRSHHPNTHNGPDETSERPLSGPSSMPNLNASSQGQPLSSCGAYHNNNSSATGTVQYPLNGSSNDLQAANHTDNPYSLI